MFWKSLVRQIALASLTIVAGGFFSVTLVRYAPGFGTDERQLDARLSRESISAIRSETGEERDIAAYYVRSLRQLLRGDLGTSHSLRRPVSELLKERLGATARLAGTGLALAWTAALVLVVASWQSRSAAVELASRVSSGLLLCLPAGGTALLLVLWNGPAYLALALVVFPKIHRYLSNLVQSAGGTSPIMPARARGLSQGRILAGHIAPMMRREVLALAGVSVGMAISAAIPVEALCGVPGLGQLAWQSALGRDLPVLLWISVLVVAGNVLANAGADLLSESGGAAA